MFINYRGVDSHSYGALLYTDLVRRFGDDLVFLDAESIPAGGDYVRELLSRVRAARVVLAVIGPNWLTATDSTGQRAIDDRSDWIRRELVEAFDAGVRVIPVLIDDAVLFAGADLPADIAALSRCQARHLRRREPTKDLDRLAADLAALDPELAAAAKAIAGRGTRPRDMLNRVERDVSKHIRKVPVDAAMFVGREDELTRLKEATGESDRVVVVALHGLGGVGKSTLAARFAEQQLDKFSPVWWVTADSVAAIDIGLADLASAVNPVWTGLPAEQRTELAVGWLAGHTGWLLILDNLTTPADANPLLERVRTGTILVTSRQSTGWRHIATVSLDVLTPAEALELLERLVRADWHDADLDGADRLCGELGWLPMAIDQAGAYLAQARITPSHYLELLEQFPARMFTATAEGGDAQRTMARVWHVTLDRLIDIPIAGDVLRRLSWYAPDNIPRALIERPEQGPEVGQALGRLAAYNMIALTADTIRVHRLVQAVTRTPDPNDPHRQPDDITQARDTTAATLEHELAGADPRRPADWSRYRMILPHALALFDHTTSSADSGHHCILADHIGTYLADQGNLNAAITLLTRAAASHEHLHGAGHPNTLTSRHNLAYAYRSVGDLARAVPLFEATLADRERVLGVDHPDTLASRRILAYVYRSGGDAARAVPLGEATLANWKRVLGVDHSNTVRSRNNLAIAYRFVGDLARAVPLFEATLADRERVSGVDHPDTLTSRNNLAFAYETVGDLARAVPLFEATLADRERVSGVDHPDTLTSRNNLAYAYRSMGDLARAVPLFEATLADRERVSGVDHPDTLTSRNNLAYAYHLAGDLARAIRLHKATLADFERLLGVDHPDTLTSRNNLAYAYRSMGDLARAIPLYMAALFDAEKALGLDHPTTKMIRSNYQAINDERISSAPSCNEGLAAKVINSTDRFSA